MPLYVRICIVLVCICQIATFSSRAQSHTLNLSDAVQRSLDNYPLIKQRQNEVAAGNAHIRSVNGNRLPSLLVQEQLDMGTANALEGAYFPLGIVPSVSGTAGATHYSPNTGNLDIAKLQWDFFNFGYYNAQYQEATAQLAVSKANLENEKYTLINGIVALYLDWGKKYRLLQIEQDNVQRAKVMLVSIRAVVLNGLKPGVDSTIAQAGYADARISYLQAQDGFNYDKIALQSYIGLSDDIIPDTSFVIADLISPSDLTDTVYAAHPALMVYEQQYELQQAGSKVIGKKYLPKVGLQAAVWSRNSGISTKGVYPGSIADGMPYSSNNYLAGLTLSYNLFDLKHRHDQLAENKMYIAASLQALQTQKVNLDKMMLQVNSSYRTTIEKLKETPVQTNAARQAFQQQMALYKAGLNTLTEVTNAQYVLRQAEVNQINTSYDLLRLQYMHAALQGQAGIFLQNSKH